MRQQVWVAGVVGMALMLHGSVWTGRLAAQGGGLGHALVVTPSGAVWAWGYNAEAQLGDNTRISRRIPAAVAGMGTVTAVAAGGSHSLALDSAGRIWAWGDNNLGAVGDGTTVDKLLPTQLALLDVVKIAAGGNHSLALRSNGDLYVWGKNTDSQLGLGTTTQQNSPVLLMSGVADIAAGGRHSAIVKTDGTAWAFGYNFNGQLADGTTTLRSTPVQMSGVTSAVAVAAGSSHTLIRRNDDTVLAAGLNFYGQIGDATTTQRTTAVSVTGLTNAVEIAAGDNHSFARLSDGTVKAWGANSTGSLGDGTTTMRTSPVTVTSLPAVSSVGSGGTFGLATTAAGVVYTWGSNAYGEQGDGTINTHALVPHAISGASFDWNVATPTLNVASGTYSFNQTVTVMNVMTGVSMHYTTTGVEPTQSDATVASGSVINVQSSQVVKVKAWKASMPPSDTAVRDYVLKVSTPTISPGGSQYTTPKTVTLSTTTSGASLYYTVDGSTPTTGSTSYSAPITISTGTVLKVLGAKAGWANSAEAPATYTFNFGTLTAPTVDPGAGPFTSGVDVTMSSAQSGATVRYTTNGSTPTTSSTAYTGPVALSASGTVKAKAFHPDYTASAETSRTYEVVTATPTFSLTAGTYAAGTPVVVSTSTPGASISYSTDGSAPTPSHPTLANGDAVIVGNSTLKAMAWKTGQTNSGAASAAYSVTGHLTAPAVSGGGSHTVALRSDGSVFAWGRNAGRELADGTATMRLQPVVSGGVTGATAISVGDGFTLARLADGRVVGWGANGFSQLGDGTTTNPRPWPVFATGITSAVAVDAGTSHALAVLTDGTIVGWGQNNAGQVGDGSTTGRTVPTPVPGVTNAVAVSAGSGFSLAVTADGTAWSWGGNGNGQLGTGNTTARSTPGTVPGLTNVRAVAAGTFTSYFLMADGTVRSVGSNAGGAGAGGALGNGTSGGQSTTPVTVSGLTNVVQIAAGSAHGLALKSDRTVWAWGNGGTGQIGNGATSDVTTPVQVAGLPAIVAIGAGATHSLALGLDGSVWAWGANSQGQLGDGSQTTRLVPVQVTMPGTGWTLPTPTLTSLTPTAGPVATSVTLTGTDFGVAQSTSTVSFNGTAATPTAWSPTSITTAVPAGASSGPVTVTVGGQTSSALSFTVASPPTLTALSPTAGPVGASVTITGTNFGASQGASTVSFNGAVASPSAWSSTSIVAPVPAGAGSGLVTVTVDGQISNGLTFALIPTPTLTALSPTSGASGATVTLTGTNFGAAQGSSVVAFNGTPAVPAAWSASSITTAVPPGASTGPVTVTVQGQVSNAISFTVIPSPTLTAITPNIGPAGTVVTVTGTNFGSTPGGSTVQFNGTSATPSAWSATSITVPVPTGATSGPVTVNVGGQLSNGLPFVVGQPTTTAVSITDPFPGTTFNAPSSLSISASVVASGPSIDRVEFYDGPLLIGTDTAAPYAVTWAAPLEGLHTLTAVAVDHATATTGSAPVEVTIAPAGATFGILGTPVASPPGGVYPPGQAVTLAAAQGAAIHYTTDGSVPDQASPTYSSPLVLSQAMVLRARAYQSGWTESAPSSDSYTIDTLGPTIVPTISPGPNAAGWNNTPVTVSFECSDPAGVANCPTPVNVTQEGAGLLVTVQAQDALGFQSALTVTVNIDSTAPAVSLSSPTADLSTVDAALALAGSASDTGSGIARAMCGTQVATLNGAAATCSVPLVPGQNTVVLAVVDAAGNSASAGIRVTRTAAPTALVIAPTTVALAVGDARGLTVTSEVALPVTGVTWTSSNVSVVTIDPANDGTIVAAALGQATVTASLGGLTATATVRVLPGAVAPGESIWTAAPTPGRYLQAPLRANPVRDEDPDLFSVEVDPLSSGVLVRAVRGADGATLWSEAVDERPQAADAFGGLLVRSAAVIPNLPNATMLQRLGGGGIAPWTYVSSGSIGSAAAGPDGTVYLIEDHIALSGQVPTHSIPFPARGDSYIVALDGRTGSVRFRVPLPNSTARWAGTTYDDRCIAQTYTGGVLTGPIAVLENGDAAVQTLEQELSQSATCPTATWNSRAVTLRVFRVSPAGAVTANTLHHVSNTWQGASTGGGDEQISPMVNRPDGHGGLLATWQQWTTGAGATVTYDSFVSRVVGGGVAFHQRAPWALYEDDPARPDVMITSNGTAYLPDGPNGEMRARSTATWASQWTATTTGQPIQGLANGGLQWLTYAPATFEPDLQELDSAGALVSSHSTLNTSAVVVLRDQDLVHGVEANGGLAMVATPFARANDWTYSFGQSKSCTPAQGRLYRDLPLAKRPHIGLVPNAEYSYDFFDTPANPAGQFQSFQSAGVKDGFKTWNDTSTAEGLTRTFRMRTDNERLQDVPANISVRKVPLGVDEDGNPIIGAFHPPSGHPGHTRITTGAMQLTTDTDYLMQEEGYKLVAMHEVGHGLGLAHPGTFIRGGTVMNTFSIPQSPQNVLESRDDRGRNLARHPTSCDVEAVRATQTP